MSGRDTMLQIFKWCCGDGHLEVAKWIHQTFQISGREALVDYNYAFKVSCENGHLEVAQWLHQTFQITREEGLVYNNFAFRWSCQEGYLRVARFVYTITREDIEQYKDRPWYSQIKAYLEKNPIVETSLIVETPNQGLYKIVFGDNKDVSAINLSIDEALKIMKEFKNIYDTTFESFKIVPQII